MFMNYISRRRGISETLLFMQCVREKKCSVLVFDNKCLSKRTKLLELFSSTDRFNNRMSRDLARREAP